MAKRVKTPATPVPQTREEAERLAAELGTVFRAIEATNAEAASKIAATKLEAKEINEPRTRQAKTLFTALAAYAEASRSDLCNDGRKTVNFAAGTLGWRLSTPAVKIDDDHDEADVIAWLEVNGLERFLREKLELDKAALLAEPDEARKVPGLAIVQTESFFFKPLEVEAEQTKVTKRVAAGVEEAA